jgi:hypothetical protein
LAYYHANETRIKDSIAADRAANPEKYRERQRKSYYKDVASSREKVRTRAKRAAMSPERLALSLARKAARDEKKKAYKASRAEHFKAKAREYYLRYRAKGEARKREQRAENTEGAQKRRAYMREYYKIRAKEDPDFLVRQRTRARIYKVITGRNRTKADISERLLGCSWQEARAHIEAQFRPGMTWNNHGNKGWHIDHIRPLASFDLTDPEQQKQAFHYTNLQPLWAHENLAKGVKFEQPNTG